MKIWYLTDARLPGQAANTVQIMKMCAAFSATGHEVSLFVRLDKDFPRNDLFAHYAVPANFRIESAPRLIPGRSSNDRWNVPFTLSALPWLKRNAGNFDLLYTRLPLLASLASRLGVRTALEAHRLLPEDGWFSRQMALGLAQNSRRDSFAGLIGISNVLSAWYADFGLSSSKILTAHDGVDLERFLPELDKVEARRRLGLPLDQRIVCYCGHLYKGRGIDELFACAAAMPDSVFLFVGGNSSDVKKYQTLAETRSLKNIQLAGFKPNGELPTYLYAADVLVMPYNDQTESSAFMSPMKLFEYMAAGRPIVASDFSSVREVLKDETNAVLVTPGNPESLRQGLEKAFDPSVADRLSKQSRRDVEKYTWLIRTRHITEFLDQH